MWEKQLKESGNLTVSTLASFAGKRFVPIVTAFAAIVLAFVLIFVWPPVGLRIRGFANWAASTSPGIAFAIYGVVERLLIPFGLHHIWNVRANR